MGKCVQWAHPNQVDPVAESPGMRPLEPSRSLFFPITLPFIYPGISRRPLASRSSPWDPSSLLDRTKDTGGLWMCAWAILIFPSGALPAGSGSLLGTAVSVGGGGRREAESGAEALMQMLPKVDLSWGRSIPRSDGMRCMRGNNNPE